MRKWECTVCGYIHNGEAPPESCPVCQAPAEKFIEIFENEKESQWKCSVCNHIHNGGTPPEKCPVCMATSDKFTQQGEVVKEEEKNNNSGDTTKVSGKAEPEGAAIPEDQEKKAGFLSRMIMKFHIHPIAVHTPNGLVPIVAVFLLLALYLGMPSFEVAAFYNMVVVLLSMPLVFMAGYIEWQHRYGGAKTFVFITKIVCTILVTLSLIILICWRFIDPSVAAPDSPYKLIYLGIVVELVVAVGIAGHLGGKLVFGTREK